MLSFSYSFFFYFIAQNQLKDSGVTFFFVPDPFSFDDADTLYFVLNEFFLFLLNLENNLSCHIIVIIQHLVSPRLSPFFLIHTKGS